MPLREMTVEVSDAKVKTPGTLAVGVNVNSESPNVLFIEPHVITGNAFATVNVIEAVADSYESRSDGVNTAVIKEDPA
jgi:uncharacterized Ntn-hydrolase superfamily protein